MTKTQELELKLGGQRRKLAEAIGTAEPDMDAVNSLTAEIRQIDDLLTAQRLVEPEPPEVREAGTGETDEQRERVDLERRANVGDVFGLVVNGGAPSGAMAELQQHLGLASNEISIRQLMNLEHRAVTPAPGEVGTGQQPIRPYVFPQSASAFLDVDMPVVGVGEAVFPVLTAELSVEALAEHAPGTETTGAFSADVLSPSRLQASFFYSREDRARFAGMDAALRMNRSDGLQDGLDRQIIRGTNGFLTGTNLANHNVSTKTTYALYRSQFAFGRVDGRIANEVGQVRSVVGAETYAHAANEYRGNNDNQDALQSLRTATGGVRVSAHVAAVSGTKQEAIIRMGNNPDAVAPLWENVAIIPDEITKAANGQIVLTAVMLYNFKILRTDGYYKQQTQHA